MTDIQAWRRNMHLSAPRLADLAGYGSSPENVSLSTSPSEYPRQRPQPRKSLASFASYISTHRAASGSKPEWPSIDWSNLNDKDNVYRPDPDSMCSALQRHILTNPSADLPAQHNSFVLHVLEAYHRLKGDKEDLQQKLHAEEQCHQADADEFHLIIQSLSTMDESKPPKIGELRFSDPAGDRSSKFSSRARNSGSKLESLLSRFDNGYSIKPKRCDRDLDTQGCKGEYIAFSQPEIPRTSSQLSGQVSVVATLDWNHNLTQPSPPISVTRVVNPGASSTEGDSFSDEEYPAALTSIALAATDYWNKGRLPIQQFEHHNGWQPGVALSETSDNWSNSNEAQRDACPSVVANMPPKLASTANKFSELTKSKGFQRLKSEALGKHSHLPDEMRLKPFHRRGFSFLPGDDSGTGRPQSLISHTKSSPDRAFTPLAYSKDVPSKASSGAARVMGIFPASRPRPQLAKAIASLTEEEKSAKVLQREGSSKSVLTAIREGSSRSSSNSHQDSLGSNDGSVSLTGTRKGPGDNTFAVAAARAARNWQAELGRRTND